MADFSGNDFYYNDYQIIRAQSFGGNSESKSRISIGNEINFLHIQRILSFQFNTFVYYKLVAVTKTPN